MYKNARFDIINIENNQYNIKKTKLKGENMNENQNCPCMEEKLNKELKEILEQYTTSKDNLIPILNEVQMKYGYIPKTAQQKISVLLKG